MKLGAELTPAMLMMWELYLVCGHMELGAELTPAMLVVWGSYI